MSRSTPVVHDARLSRKRGLAERTANVALGALDRFDARLLRLDQQDILDTARRRFQTEDWGDRDFLEPMGVILEHARGAIDPIGKLILRGGADKAMKHRVLRQRLLANRPEITQRAIERPIFVLGFPRTGTTVLQNLLAQEAGYRALQFWELTNPVPLHADPGLDRRRRLASADRDLAIAYTFVPEMTAVHEVAWNTYEECWPLFANSFSVLNFDLAHGLRGYGDWLLRHDMRWAYADYRQQLQVLIRDEADTERLVLKCPEHLWFLDSLLHAFPDACVVWPHRDPVSSVASYSSMISLMRRTMYGGYEPAAVGEHIQTRFHQGVERAMAARADADADRFYDVHFHDLVADPVRVVHQILDHFDLKRTRKGEGRMRTWLANKRGDARGMHRYDADYWGLRPAAIHEQFGDYIRRFDIRLADTASA